MNFINDFSNCNESLSINDTCICNDGFSKVGDWVVGSACPIFIPVHSALWIFVISVYSITTIISTPKVISAYKRIQLNNKQKKVTQRKNINQNFALIALFVHIAFTTTSAIGLGILELLTEERVGISWSATILFFLWRSSFYFESGLFQPYMLYTIVGRSGKKARDTLNESNRKAKYLFILVGFVGVIVFTSPFTSNQQAAVSTFAIYNILVAILQIGFFYQAKHLKKEITHILDLSYSQLKQESILEVKAKLVRSQNTVMKQTTFVCILSLAQGIIPFFWNKFSYFLPFVVFLPTILFMNVVKQFSNNSKKGNSTNDDTSARSHENTYNKQKRVKQGNKKIDQLKKGKHNKKTTDQDDTTTDSMVQQTSNYETSQVDSWVEKKRKIIKNTEQVLTQVGAFDDDDDTNNDSRLEITDDGTDFSVSFDNTRHKSKPYIHGLELSMAGLSDIPADQHKSPARRAHASSFSDSPLKSEDP